VIVVFVLMAFAIAHSLVLGAGPLVQRRPWIVDGRVQAAVLTGAIIIGVVADQAGLWSALGWSGAASTGTLAGDVGPLVVAIFLVIGLAWRGFSVIGVRDEDFRTALDDALRSGGYEYEVLVDARERPSTIVLSGTWQGVELKAWSSFGSGTVRGKGASGRLVAADVVEHMRAAFVGGVVRPPLGPRVAEIACGCVLAVYVIVSVL